MPTELVPNNTLITATRDKGRALAIKLARLTVRARFGHDPARWAEFQARYRTELADPQREQTLDALAERARQAPVTLVLGRATRNTTRPW